MKIKIATSLFVLTVGAIVLGAVVGPAFASSHDDMVGPECAAVPATAGQPDPAAIAKWLGDQAKAGKKGFLVVPGTQPVLCAW